MLAISSGVFGTSCCGSSKGLAPKAGPWPNAAGAAAALDPMPARRFCSMASRFSLRILTVNCSRFLRLSSSVLAARMFRRAAGADGSREGSIAEL